MSLLAAAIVCQAAPAADSQLCQRWGTSQLACHCAHPPPPPRPQPASTVLALALCPCTGPRWWWAGTTATRALAAGCREWMSTPSSPLKRSTSGRWQVGTVIHVASGRCRRWHTPLVRFYCYCYCSCVVLAGRSPRSRFYMESSTALRFGSSNSSSSRCKLGGSLWRPPLTPTLQLLLLWPARNLLPVPKPACCQPAGPNKLLCACGRAAPALHLPLCLSVCAAVVIDPIQSVKGKVVIDAFRCIR